MQDYEESTAFLGQWGRFQQKVFFLLCVSILTNGLGGFFIVFVADTPAHHCLIPDVNLTIDWSRAIIPIKGFLPGRDVNLTDLEQESCVDGWSYSKDIYQSTLVTEFDLVCNDQWKKPFTSTVLFLGILSGSLISGLVSDRFGRKPVFFATTGVQAIFTLVAIFSPSWVVFIIVFYLGSLGQMSNFVSAFVLGSEILNGKVRVLLSSAGINLSFAVGYMLLSLLAYFLRDWKSLMLALSLPGLLYLPLWWFIPESPRWLLSRGRIDEAEAVLRKAAKMNKVQAPQIIFNSVHEDQVQPTEDYNFFTLVRNASLRKTMMILSLMWFTLSTGYAGLSLNTSQLHTDPYLSCFISGAVEVPAYISCWLALRYLPRRLAIIGMLVLGGMSLYLIQAVPEDLPGVSIALEMVGKFAFTAGLVMAYVYTSELFPTLLRNTATGTCSAVSRVGSALSPFILELRAYSKYLPQTVLGTLGFLAVFATVFLPESFGHPLPQTIEEMQERKRIKFPCMKKKATSKFVVVFESQL